MSDDGMKTNGTMKGVRTAADGGYVVTISIPETERESAMALLGLVPQNVELTVKVIP